MSSELVWNVIKNNSAFLRKQKQGCKITTFSTDKMNITNVYSPKCMGICQKHAVGLNCEGKHIILSTKSTKNVTKPCKMAADAHVKRVESVCKVIEKGTYSPCYKKAVVARYNALDLAIRRAKKGYVNKKRTMGRAH